MIHIKPFIAIRPPAQYAARVASVPYDTVNRSEAAALASDNPMCFLHISRAEIDLPENVNTHSEAVYEKALENFQSFQNRGILIRETTPHLYLYRLIKGTQSQKGIVACCHVDDYEKDVIKKHENTRPDKEYDRTCHISRLKAHTGPVFMTYRDQPGIDQMLDIIETEKPLYDFAAPDGVSHTIWSIPNSKTIVTAFRKVPACYIADGHHRAASAVQVARERQAANARLQGNQEYNWFLAVLFPANQLCILPYNRCVRDLNGKTEEEFLESVRSRFTLTANASPSPGEEGHISMYIGRKWHSLSWNTAGARNDLVTSLDVSVLHDRLLGPVLEIHDPRTNSRIEFIGGIRGTDELEKRVDSGEAAVAFSMFPTSVHQLMAIADAGQIMPPKSTWFEPKLRSGLLVHTF